MNSESIMKAAKTVDDAMFANPMSTCEGRTLFERIVADDGVRPTVALSRNRGRRPLVLGAALAALAGAAVVIVGVPGLPHNGASSAYSIAKKADGSIEVTFAWQDFSDPATLQRLDADLAAVGARARVYLWSDDCAATTPQPVDDPVGRGTWLGFEGSGAVPSTLGDSTVFVIRPQRLAEGLTGIVAGRFDEQAHRLLVQTATTLPESTCLRPQVDEVTVPGN